MKKRIAVVGGFRIQHNQIIEILKQVFGADYDFDLSIGHLEIKNTFGAGVINSSVSGIINGTVPHKTRFGLNFSEEGRIIVLDQDDQLIPFESCLSSKGELKGTTESLRLAAERLKRRIELIESGQPDILESLTPEREVPEKVLGEIGFDLGEGIMSFVFVDQFHDYFPKRNKKIKKIKASKKNKKSRR